MKKHLPYALLWFSTVGVLLAGPPPPEMYLYSPDVLGLNSPVILTGNAVLESFVKYPDKGYIAMKVNLKVDRVEKNIFSNFPIKVGDTLPLNFDAYIDSDNGFDISGFVERLVPPTSTNATFFLKLNADKTLAIDQDWIVPVDTGADRVKAYRDAGVFNDVDFDGVPGKRSMEWWLSNPHMRDYVFSPLEPQPRPKEWPSTLEEAVSAVIQSLTPEQRTREWSSVNSVDWGFMGRDFDALIDNVCALNNGNRTLFINMGRISPFIAHNTIKAISLSSIQQQANFWLLLFRENTKKELLSLNTDSNMKLHDVTVSELAKEISSRVHIQFDDLMQPDELASFSNPIIQCPAELADIKVSFDHPGNLLDLVNVICSTAHCDLIATKTDSGDGISRFTLLFTKSIPHQQLDSK